MFFWCFFLSFAHAIGLGIFFSGRNLCGPIDDDGLTGRTVFGHWGCRSRSATDRMLPAVLLCQLLNAFSPLSTPDSGRRALICLVPSPSWVYATGHMDCSETNPGGIFLPLPIPLREEGGREGGGITGA